MVDVNFLKRMNDTHGHEKGNEYLKNAANLISYIFGEDRVYRTGGDEFVVILEGDEPRKVEGLIAQFKGAVAQCQSTPGLQPWQQSPRRSAWQPGTRVGMAAPRMC